MKAFLLLLALASVAFAANGVPDANLPPTRMMVPNGTYGPGVDGGIPARTAGEVTLPVTSGDNIDSALAAAVAASDMWASELAFKIPPGTYYTGGYTNRVAGGIYSSGAFTIRGSGSGVTTLICQNSWPAFNMGIAADRSTPVTVTSGLTRDSTSVVVSDTSNFGAGRQALIMIPNDDRIPAFALNNGDQYVRTWPVRVLSVNSGTGTVTFTPPLPEDFSDVASHSGLPVKMNPEENVPFVYNVGIESMTIDKTGYGGTAILFENASNCWLKDVKTIGTTGHGVKITSSINMLVQTSHVGPSPSSGSNASGLLIEGSSNVLVADSIFEDNQPAVEIWIASMNVVLTHCYIPRATNGLAITVHNTHSSYLFFVNSCIPGIQIDSYYGGNSRITAHRNWITGRNGTPASSTTNSTTDIQTMVRKMAFVGNVIQSPGYTYTDNGFFLGYPYQFWTAVGTVQPSLGSWWYDYDAANLRPKYWLGTIATKSAEQYGTVTFDTAVADSLEVSFTGLVERKRGAGGTLFSARSGNTYTISGGGYAFPEPGQPYQVWPGVYGFRARDLDVEATTTRVKNFNYYDNAIPVSEQTSDTLDASLFYSVKPDWMGDKNLAPFDSANPPSAFNNAALAVLPAAHRYLYGNTNYLTGGGGGETVIYSPTRPKIFRR